MSLHRPLLPTLRDPLSVSLLIKDSLSLQRSNRPLPLPSSSRGGPSSSTQHSASHNSFGSSRVLGIIDTTSSGVGKVAAGGGGSSSRITSPRQQDASTSLFTESPSPPPHHNHDHSLSGSSHHLGDSNPPPPPARHHLLPLVPNQSVRRENTIEAARADALANAKKERRLVSDKRKERERERSLGGRRRRRRTKRGGRRG